MFKRLRSNAEKTRIMKIRYIHNKIEIKIEIIKKFIQYSSN